MKLLIGLIILLFSTQSYAGMGGCVVYKAKYVLTNGSSVTGFLPLFSDEDYSQLDNNKNKYCDDRSFQKLINTVFYQQQHTLVFNIYTKLHAVNFGMVEYYPDNSSPINFSFTDSASIVPLHLDSIKFTIFLDAKLADWAYNHVSIEILDSRTSRMMQKSEVINLTALRYPPILEGSGSNYYHEFENYMVLNYNKNISLDDLMEEMAKLSEKMYTPELKFVKSTSKNKEQIFEQEKRNTVVPVINKLRQKGIILIRVYETG